jgi:hypothetical protein
MNERIKLLADQAELTIRTSIGTYMSHPEFNQKFAELIVGECVRYFNEDYVRDFDTLWREDLSKGIKEHFGVEE